MKQKLLEVYAWNLGTKYDPKCIKVSKALSPKEREKYI